MFPLPGTAQSKATRSWEFSAATQPSSQPTALSIRFLSSSTVTSRQVDSLSSISMVSFSFKWKMLPLKCNAYRKVPLEIYIRNMGFNLFLYSKEAWLLLLMTSRYFWRLEESKIDFLWPLWYQSQHAGMLLKSTGKSECENEPVFHLYLQLSFQNKSCIFASYRRVVLFLRGLPVCRCIELNVVTLYM